MRIAYVSNFRPAPRYKGTEEYVAQALADLGHEVIRFQVPPYRRRGAIARLEPDVILLHHSRDLPSRWIRALPRENPRALVVQWLFDHVRPPAEEKWFLARARAWHVSFLKDRGRFPAYRAEGIACHWLHQGAPAGFAFASEPDPRHACDVAFLGNPHHEFRIEVLKRIQAEGFRVHVYTNPANFGPWHRAGFEHVFENVHDAQMGPVCASARFVLAVGFYLDEWEGYWSNRIYMTLASGGLPLTQYVRGMEEHFEHGKHLLWWRSPDECLSLIREYADRPDERERIRRAGYEEVHRRHTYHDRAREFAAVCEEHLARLRAREPAPRSRRGLLGFGLARWLRGG